MEKIAREVVQEDAAFPGGHVLLAWALANRGGETKGSCMPNAFLLADKATPQERTHHRHRPYVEGQPGRIAPAWRW